MEAKMRFDEWYPFLDEAAQFAVKIRRELHKWPEIGGRECKTADLIEEELKKMDLIPERVLPTGICARINSSESVKTKKTILLRADIDGLPITEETGLPFSSDRFGYMHACGHDVHTAILLGTALLLNRVKKPIDLNVKLIFQPDEENEGGARQMINQGILYTDDERERKVDMILGLHVMPDLSAGSIGFKYDKVHAASLMFKIKIIGIKSHGAEPHKGIDAITGAVQLISAVQFLITRELSPVRSGLITFGKINGGEARNIIAEEVMLEGIIRGEDEGVCLFLKNRLGAIVSHIAQALSLRVEQEYDDGYPALINDTGALNHVRGAVRKFNEYLKGLGSSGKESYIKVKELKDLTMAVDDFAYYLEDIPGAYFFLGSGFPDQKNSGLHTGRFIVNEQCIKTGIAALAASVLCENK